MGYGDTNSLCRPFGEIRKAVLSPTEGKEGKRKRLDEMSTQEIEARLAGEGKGFWVAVLDLA